MRRRRYRKQPIQKKESTDQFLKPTVQTKLNMGKPGDKYEVEADNMADKVVNNKKGDGAIQKKEGEEEVQQKPLASSITPLVQKMGASEEENTQAKLQRKEEEPAQAKEEEEVQKKGNEEEVQAKEEEEVQKKGDEEEAQAKEEEEVQKKGEDEEAQAKEDEEAQAKEEEEVQKKSNGHQNKTHGIEKKLRNGSGGQKIDATTKAEMEQGFGADFSHVRIHNDAEAQHMSKDIGAQAFTHGNDIYFSDGKYNPNSKEGKHLLAHELTHTIQQKGAVAKREVPNVQKQDKKPPVPQETKSEDKKVSKDGDQDEPEKNLKVEVMKKLKAVSPEIHQYISSAGINGGLKEVRNVKGKTKDINFRLSVKTENTGGNQLAVFINKGKLGDPENPNRVTHVLKIGVHQGINTDPATQDNIDKYAKYLYHEGLHMLLHMSSITTEDGLKPDPLKISFDQYLSIANKDSQSTYFKNYAFSALKKYGLEEAIEDTPQKQEALLKGAAKQLYLNCVEEKFVRDYEKKHFNNTDSNVDIAITYILSMLTNLKSKMSTESQEFLQMVLTMKGILDKIDSKIQKSSKPSEKPKK